MERTIQPFFNDLRQGDYYLSSEVKNLLNQLTTTQIQQASNIQEQSKVVENALHIQQLLSVDIRQHLKLVKKLNKAVDWVNEERNYIRKLKGQKTLSDY
jgi:glyceraldehyde-3-phosphate dehydrogenase/erythrose-4-phosphate dehydrogenase